MAGRMAGSSDDASLSNASPPRPHIVSEFNPESPILPPVTPAPTLTGFISAGTIRGTWGMTREAALSDEEIHTSRFEYKLDRDTTEIHDVTGPQSGSYSGHFYMRVPGKLMPVKVLENRMTLKFTPNTAGMLNVRGQGQNCYGSFAIFGTCKVNGQDLELARAYAPKPSAAPPQSPKHLTSVRKPIGKNLSQVQAALSEPRMAKFSSSQATHVEHTSSAFDIDRRRPARTRKAPLHLRDALTCSTAPIFNCSEASGTLRRYFAIVTSLMRSSGADWFLAPVDAEALCVPHYNSIIDSPMDLGSIKHGLDHGFYSDPNVVAADLRLVFRNAMTFNVLPEAFVHEAARDLHVRFEEQVKATWKHLGGVKRNLDTDVEGGGKRSRVSAAKSVPKKGGKGKTGPREDDIGTLSTRTGMVPVADLVCMQRQMESMQATIAALQKQASQTEVQVQMNMELGVTQSGYGPAKIAAHNAKSLTFDEKEALSNDINNLPPEKLAHVVKIVQESMPLTSRHDGDEIEVDIETLDNETLRGLQKYVKASLGKKRPIKKRTQHSLTSTEQELARSPEAALASDTRLLESVAFGDSGLETGFNSDAGDDDDELGYDVLDS